MKLQLLLCRISNARNVDLTSAFHPKDSSPFWLAVYIGLVVLLMVSVVLGIMFGQSFALLMVLSLILNVYVHESRRLKCEPEIIQVNYCVSLVLALNRIRKLNLPGTEPYLAEAYRHLEPMKKIIRSGPVMSKLNVDPLQGTTFAVFMTDLIAFEVLKKRLAKYHEHFLAVHEAVGQIDAAIAVASCRAGLETWCEPEIDFDADHPYIRASLRRNWEDIHRNIEEDDRFRKLPFIRNLIRKRRRECEDGDDDDPPPFFFRRDKVPSPSTEGKSESPAPAPDTGAGWVERLRAHPEDGAACEWGKLGAEDWIRLLSSNPEWAWRPEWRRLVPEGEWKAFLRERRREESFRSASPAPKSGRWFRPPAA